MFVTMALMPVLLALALFPAGRSFAAAPLFEDGFESGNLSKWTASAGLTVQTAEAHAGSAAKNTQSAAWAYHQLGTTSTDLYGRIWFKTLSYSTSYTLLRFRTGSGGSILRLFVSAAGKLAYRNDVGAVSRVSTTSVSTGQWHEAQVHVNIAGSSGRVEVWLEGNPVASRTENLGTASVGRFEIGNRATDSIYSVAIDDVAVDVAFIGGTSSTPPTPPGNLRQPVPATASTVDLEWDASADDGTVTGYTIYRDNLEIGTVDGNTTTYQDTAVASDTKYSYAVVAVDDGGNRSTRSDALLVTMPGFDQGPGPGTDAVVFAAGDIACNSSVATPTSCRQGPTSDILVNGGPDAVLPLGDLQYPSGALSTFQTHYDPSWGRVRLGQGGAPLTRPAPGNHEYQTTGAAGYFSYFGAAAGDPTKGYYSYDVGAWHLIALNSNCGKVGGCSTSSAQYAWLAQDLAHPDNQAACTLAYWHHPRWTSPSEGHSSNVSVDPLWDLLVARGADVVLSGHNHHYERFALQNGAGVLDPFAGVRQFVVGTGGKNHVVPTSFAPNSEARDTTTFGVLKLSLHPDSYDWNFVPEAGGTFTDSGSQACSPLP
jgi:fibronectin type III domain protein/calcineurin-like phosphoesterase family protein